MFFLSILPFQRVYLLPTHNASLTWRSVMRALWEVPLLALPPRSDWMSSVQWFRRCFFKNSATFSKEKTNVLECKFTEFPSSQALLTVEYGKIRFRSCILAIPLAPGICDKWLQNVLLSFFQPRARGGPPSNRIVWKRMEKMPPKEKEGPNEQPTEDAHYQNVLCSNSKKIGTIEVHTNLYVSGRTKKSAQ